jgi:hypothetical protein
VPNKNGDLDIRGALIDTVLDSATPLDKDQSYTNISSWSSPQNLFARRPCIEDVKQRAVGDCFLLAALHAIIQTNPDLIYGMMRDRRRDDRSGWVVVRLYDAAGQPVFYEVEKTYVTTGWWRPASLQGHGAWWVYMLEKAYAVHRLRVGGHTVKPTKWELDPKIGRVVPKEGAKRDAKTYVEALSGGFTHDALQTLLGGSKVLLRLQPEGNQSVALVNLLYIVGNRRRAVTDEDTRSAFRNVFGQYADRAVQEFAGQYSGMKVAGFGNNFSHPAKVFRQENLLAFFEQNYRLSRFVGARLKSYICKHFPGKRGTGVYTVAQERLYAKIQEMLAAPHFVAVGSGTNLGRGRGGIAATNEHQVKGLAGPHAYQVVGLAKVRDTELKFLRLRNPWLQYVRSYNWKNAVVQGQNVQVLTAAEVDNAPQIGGFNLEAPVALGAGEFLLELSDLTKRFDKLYFASGKDRELPGLGELQALVV